MSILNDPNVRKSIAKEISRRIDEYCVKIYDEGPRWHLGASIIGGECPREIWYSFRWVFHKVFSGRMYRLFNRGHLEEKRNLEWLRGIGCDVRTTNQILHYHGESDCYFYADEFEPGDGLVEDVSGSYEHIRAAEIMGVFPNQIKIIGTISHFGGSLDAQGIFPPDLDITENLLFEFKTKKTGAEFNEIKKKGIKACNWQHFVQMSIYGKNKNIKFAVYIVTNKNDDDMYIEIVQLDWQLAEEKEKLASEIINSRQAPPRPFASRAYMKCKTSCDYVGICWDNVQPQINCRSCWKSKPIENSEWFCEQFNMQIPRDFVPKGCPHWEAVK